MCTVCHGVSRWPTRMQSEGPTIYTVQYMCIAINLGRKFANYHLSSYQLTTVCCVEKPKSEFPTLNLEKMV